MGFMFRHLVKIILPICNWAFIFKFEYSFLARNGMFKAIEQDDFESRYSNLINGLDEKSIQTVDRILTRIQIAKKWYGLSKNLYNSNERKDFLYLTNNLEKNIRKISKGCYTNRQYKLPVPQFEACVFMSIHGIPEIKTNLSILKQRIL